MTDKKALVAMSGGVDSSVAAYLLKQDRFSLIGAMMKLYSGDETEYSRGCCGIDDANDARAVAAALDIPFYVFNFTEIFKKEVMDRFVRSYESGETPNPCIDCNRFLKFGRLIRRAWELETKYVATGHYARVEKNIDGRYLLKKGVDPSKDQSYVLFAMTQEELAHTLFPLGELTKEEARLIASEQGFINAGKRDSQDICFASDKNYAKFIKEYSGKEYETGNFVSPNGKILGTHKGIVHYTIGQRKGLGISSQSPLFVSKISPSNNTVTLVESDKLFKKHLTAREINLIPFDKLDGKLICKAKIRYAHTPADATIWQTDTDSLHVEFKMPQRAITPGQAIVFYDGNVVIGGGIINPYPDGSSNL